MAALVVALWVGSYWAVPWLVTRQVVQQGSALLGREVSVGEVDFKPWSLQLVAHDLAVASLRPGVPLLRVKRLMVDADITSVWHLAPVIDALQIEAPELALSRDAQGAYDFEDVLAHLSARPSTGRDQPLRYALHNLQLTQGQIRFDDQKVSGHHDVTGLQLTLPFLSNLPSQREVKVLPHLAFDLHGSHFSSSAEAIPFAPRRTTEALLTVKDLDLKPYLAYWPASLPAKLTSAMVDLDLTLGFEQAPDNRLRIRGQVRARQLGVATPAGQPLLSMASAHLELAELLPFERLARMSKLELQAPQVTLRRGSDHLLQWPVSHTGEASAVPAPAAKSAGVPAQAAWQVTLEKLLVHAGGIRWVDQAVQPAAQIDVQQMELDAGNLGWPVKRPLSLRGSAVLQAAQGGGQLSYAGLISTQSAQVTATVANLSLAVAAPYLKPWLRLRPGGMLQADLGLSWKRAADGQDDMGIHASRLTVDKPVWTQLEGMGAAGGGEPVQAAAESLSVEGVDVQLMPRTLKVDAVTLKSPRITVERGTDGHWMWERWLNRPPAAADGGRVATEKTTAPPWKTVIGRVGVEGAAIRFSDRGGSKPVSLDVSSLNLSLQDIAPGTGQPLAWRLGARIGAGGLAPGSLAAQGTATLVPLGIQAAITAQRLPAHALAPYAGDLLRFDLLRADAGYQGQAEWRMTPQGGVLKLGGDVSVEDFNANSLASSRRDTGADPGASGPADVAPRSGLRLGNELLNWKALVIRGLEVAAAPGAQTQVDVKEAVLSDFFARVIVRDNGRLNLQDLVRTAATAPPALKTVSTLPDAASGTAVATAPKIHIGPVSLIHGKVYFSDRFIKPNYSADLTELTGRLGAFSSEPQLNGDVRLADLSLRGRAEGTASLEIQGKLNPLAKPLALDIQGKVNNLELPPLSPYAIKYVGHGIERGKLSMDVAYQVKPDGQLTANNRLVLNQLTFGDPVDGAKESLPVKLATALLADRDGVIDLELPISGSLNDPHFSLGPVLFKVVMGVIGKALTSPFSLLTKALGGEDHASLSEIAFPAGSARLTTDARKALDKVAQAMAEKPGVRVTVAGEARLDVERDALLRERLLSLVRAEKRRAVVVSLVGDRTAGLPSDPGVGDGSSGDVSADEYPRLLKEVYRRSDVPKPRNLIGMAKEVSVDDMEKLLLANLSASPESLRQLALQRGMAVKDYLAAQGVPVERLFLGGAQTAGGSADWVPHAALTLAFH